MAKNKMSDLRNHLFETLEALKDSEAPMDLGRAKAISEVAQTIINSAKVEVEFLKAIDASTSRTEFFEAYTPARIEEGERKALPIRRSS